MDKNQTTQLVSSLRRAAERMEELITAMLDVSQLDVNAMDLHLVQTAPETIIKMAVDPLTEAIQQRRLTLEAKGLSGLPMIDADMQRLVQAFQNVIVNAIKFTPDGGRIDIEASLQPKTDAEGRDHLLFTIQDTGVGIAEKDKELIFQKFYRGFDPQLHSTGTYKFLGAGPGLGVTIAKGIIEGHGGKIWVESDGQDLEKLPGSTFFILIPVHPPSSARRVMPFDNNEQAQATVEQPQIDLSEPQRKQTKPLIPLQSEPADAQQKQVVEEAQSETTKNIADVSETKPSKQTSEMKATTAAVDSETDTTKN